MKIRNTLLLALLGCLGLTAQAQPKTFTRNKVLLEKYTGIACAWCPSGDRAVESYLGRHPEHRGVMVEMRHNAYTTPDVLTVPIHTALDAVWKPSGYPKYYMDRCSYMGNQSSNVRDYSIDWGQFNDTNFDPVKTRLDTPTYVSLDLDGSAFDPASGELTIYAHGEVTKELPDLCINAFIVQDINGYENTSRASMTADINGDDLRVFDGQYKVTLTTKLEDTYGRYAPVPSDMKVIVFVSSRFATDAQGNRDFTYSEVHNTEVVSLSSLPTKSSVPERCTAPTINIQDGQVVFECSTPGASFTFSVEPIEKTTTATTVSPVGDESPAFIIKASAGTADLFPSEEVSRQFTLKDILVNEAPSAVNELKTTRKGDTTVYSISGQRVATQSGSRAVVPGLYIVGGKKVLR